MREVGIIGNQHFFIEDLLFPGRFYSKSHFYICYLFYKIYIFLKIFFLFFKCNFYSTNLKKTMI
jgi:hypothetical protein